MSFKSVAVSLAFERPLNRHADVIGLLVAELIDLDSNFGQMQARHLLVQVLGQRVHAVLVLVGVVPKLDLGNGLVGE